MELRRESFDSSLPLYNESEAHLFDVSFDPRDEREKLTDQLRRKLAYCEHNHERHAFESMESLEDLPLERPMNRMA